MKRWVGHQSIPDIADKGVGGVYNMLTIAVKEVGGGMGLLIADNHWQMGEGVLKPPKIGLHYLGPVPRLR